jgi:hypothetical protein
MKGGVKFVLPSQKFDREMQIKCPIDDKSIDFVESIECHISRVQFKVEPFGGDVCPRFRKGIEDDYDMYESNLCFKGFMKCV